MKIIEAFLVVLSIGLSAMYFTTANPQVEAMTENEANMMYVVIERVRNLEKKAGIKVPDQLKLRFNGQLEK